MPRLRDQSVSRSGSPWKRDALRPVRGVQSCHRRWTAPSSYSVGAASQGRMPSASTVAWPGDWTRVSVPRYGRREAGRSQIIGAEKPCKQGPGVVSFFYLSSPATSVWAGGALRLGPLKTADCHRCGDPEARELSAATPATRRGEIVGGALIFSPLDAPVASTTVKHVTVNASRILVPHMGTGTERRRRDSRIDSSISEARTKSTNTTLADRSPPFASRNVRQPSASMSTALTRAMKRESEPPSSAGARRSKRLAAGRLARFPQRLTLLPPDILLLILDWVAIDLTSQWDFLPLNGVDRGRAIALANGSRRSLSRLARTCRCLYLPTMRRLLGSIYIYEGDSAARLLHFLFNRVEMRQHIHEVHVMDWLTINFESSCRRALADIGWNFESLSPIELAVMGSTRSENLTAKTHQTRSTGFHGGRDKQAVGQALGPSLVVTILLFTTALRTLRLTLPGPLNDKTLLQMESQLALAQTTYGLRPLQGVSAMGFTEFPGTSEFFGRDARPNPRWISLFTCQSESLRRLELGGGMLLDANETRTLSENEFPLRRLQHLRVSNISLQDIR
ncbi:hypothetical protein Purlil1_13876 [Purpureocillium lilacinum]|uniref:F-box domain-containing protein n=1 Tax=Purpureocillium lilacinum TaxID=33203 RepID=A0ABR0BCU9_PURLI|nr:hypothetical protein Purlil1_13876 [Purpureocillium lilacinum]